MPENADRIAPVWLNRQTPPHILTLVMITGLGAWTMNVFLPSLPAIAKHFNADYSVVQLTISGYLGCIALLQLIYGPLSDRFGRRPVLVGAFAIFLVATLGCALAPNIETFLAFRMLQASVAAGMVLSRAIVRDMVPKDQAASMIGYVTMGMAVVPMIGPAFGGILDQNFGWQSTFYATLLFGALALALIWHDLGETNQSQSTSFTSQFRAYPELLRSRRFWGYSLTAGFASGAFFAFLGGAPYVATQILGISPTQLGLYMGVIALGYLLGNFLSGRFSTRLGVNRMMLMGGMVTSFAMLLALTLFGLGLVHPLSFFGSFFFMGIGNGLTLPNANAGIVSVRPQLAGSASGLGGSLMIGAGAALSAISGTLLGPETGIWPLLWMMLGSALAGLLATFWVIRVERSLHPTT